MQVSIAEETPHASKQSKDPFTIGVISHPSQQDQDLNSDYLHHKNRSIKHIEPFNPEYQKDDKGNLSDIQFGDSDQKRPGQ